MARGYLRIGELGQRVGVSPDLLRAWERRYGLLRPERSPGGFRLYSPDDEARVRRMVAHLGRGLAAAEAARMAESAEIGQLSVGDPVSGYVDDLRRALDTFDEAAVQKWFDRAIWTFSLDNIIGDIVLPYLVELGERWEGEEITVAQEHFASNIIRTRLLGLAQGWDSGIGPRALLACAEGELHDIALVAFGLVLSRRGWRITYLGANTPIDTLEKTADLLDPEIVVIAASEPRWLRRADEGLRTIAARHRLLLAGRGVEQRLAAAVGAEALTGDVLESAAYLTEGAASDG
jgi:MerR family transcriptional regulator, light-induced transcriptional regulator